MAESSYINSGDVILSLSGAGAEDVGTIKLPYVNRVFMMKNVRVVRKTQAGTPYTPSSLKLELWNRDPAHVDADLTNLILRRTGLEPDTEELIMSETESTLGAVIFESNDDPKSGLLYVKAVRAGGDGTSVETIKFHVDAERRL